MITLLVVVLQFYVILDQELISCRYYLVLFFVWVISSKKPKALSFQIEWGLNLAEMFFE